VVAALTVVLAVAQGGCAPAPLVAESVSPPTASPPTAAPPSPALPTGPAASPSAAPPSAAPTPAPAPADTDLVEVKAAGLVLPVPRGWEIADEAALGDATTRTGLAARFPGIDRLLGAFDGLGERAAPALLAVDPSSGAPDASMPTSISVVVAQPPVEGFLLDMVAGFIETGVSDALGVPAAAERSREGLAVGEAVHMRFPGQGKDPVEAEVWVVGAPAGTVLVAAVGTPDALEALEPEAIVAAMRPLAGVVP
jgi:hypothetical protein